jgi:hypothetical protein
VFEISWSKFLPSTGTGGVVEVSCGFPQILYKMRGGNSNLADTASFQVFSSSLLNYSSVIHWSHLSQALLKPKTIKDTGW